MVTSLVLWELPVQHPLLKGEGRAVLLAGRPGTELGRGGVEGFISDSMTLPIAHCALAFEDALAVMNGTERCLIK